MTGANIVKWEDIHDPTGEFDFAMEWTLVGSEYLPEDIQSLINKKGVQGMVQTVNEHFKLNMHGKAVMYLGYVGDRKTVTQA